jgi:hypothetical protein
MIPNKRKHTGPPSPSSDKHCIVGAQPIERAVLFGQFLERCRQRGVLSDDDLELLLQFKLDELPFARFQASISTSNQIVRAFTARREKRECRGLDLPASQSAIGLTLKMLLPMALIPKN